MSNFFFSEFSLSDQRTVEESGFNVSNARSFVNIFPNVLSAGRQHRQGQFERHRRNRRVGEHRRSQHTVAKPDLLRQSAQRRTQRDLLHPRPRSEILGKRAVFFASFPVVH